MAEPWNIGVSGEQVKPLINADAKLIRVEAGPGTGKTFGLARRVVRIMHADGLAVPGRKVLVVAFNRVIANQLRIDIEAELARAGLTDDLPVIRTIHALCLEAISEPVRLLLLHEVQAMIYDVRESVPAIRGAYDDHRATEQALRDHEAKHEDHIALWQAVQHWLVRHKARLISELPSLLLDRIHGGDFSEKGYDHVIVDEFQDLTAGEQQLVLLLAGENGSVVALGDPRQSIYAFRGNDREGLAKLSAHSPEDFPMTECRRCPEAVVKAANRLMTLSSAAAMVPAGPASSHIDVVLWKTPKQEAEGMAQLVCENARAYPKDRHLVMVTRRDFGYMLRDELARIDPALAVDLTFSESILETKPVREAFSFFSLLVDPDRPSWRAWLGQQGSTATGKPAASNRNAAAYLKFLAANKDEIDADAIFDLASQPRSTPRGAGGLNLWDRAKRFTDLHGQLASHVGDPKRLITELFTMDLWVVPETNTPGAIHDMLSLRDQALQMVDEKLADAAGPVDPQKLLREVAQQLRYQIATREPFAPDSDVRVQVVTLWGAKGLTAEHVYVIGLFDEAIPGEKKPEYPGTDADFVEEQRRLFYVSITRPKHTLILSRPEIIKVGDARLLGFNARSKDGIWSQLTMSRFLRDINPLLPPARRPHIK